MPFPSHLYIAWAKARYMIEASQSVLVETAEFAMVGIAPLQRWPRLRKIS